MEKLSFGQWLSRQRKYMGLTQKQLADDISCATITLRKIESDRRRPSQQIAERLAFALDIPLEQQSAFLRFARGFSQSVSATPTRNFPWQAPAGSFSPEILASLMSHIGQSHHMSLVNGLYFDEQLHWVNQNSSQAIGALGLNDEIASGDKSPGSHDSVIFVMLVPIELPGKLAQTFLQNLTENSSIQQLNVGIEQK